MGAAADVNLYQVIGELYVRALTLELALRAAEVERDRRPREPEPEERPECTSS